MCWPRGSNYSSKMAQSLTISDRQLAVSAEEGIRHLEAADWSSSVHPESEFLAVLALRLVLAGYLVGEVKRDTSPDGTTTLRVTLDARSQPTERLSAAKLLVAPIGVYADMAGIAVEKHASDTGAVPVPVLILGGAVAVAVIAAQSYVVMYVAEKALVIVENGLKRNSATKEIQRADAEVLKLVNQHVQREIAANSTLPLDDATKLALSGLQSRVGALVQLGYQSEQGKGFPSWALPTIGLTAAAVVTAIIIYRTKGKKNE